MLELSPWSTIKLIFLISLSFKHTIVLILKSRRLYKFTYPLTVYSLHTFLPGTMVDARESMDIKHIVSLPSQSLLLNRVPS